MDQIFVEGFLQKVHASHYRVLRLLYMDTPLGRVLRVASNPKLIDMLEVVYTKSPIYSMRRGETRPSVSTFEVSGEVQSFTDRLWGPLFHLINNVFREQWKLLYSQPEHGSHAPTAHSIAVCQRT